MEQLELFHQRECETVSPQETLLRHVGIEGTELPTSISRLWKLGVGDRLMVMGLSLCSFMAGIEIPKLLGL